MPRFAYLARSAQGASLHGELVAQTELEASRLLRADGKYLVQLTVRGPEPSSGPAARGAHAVPFARTRARPDDVVLFLSQLSIMVDTGVALTEALTGIITQSPPGRLRDVQSELLRDVESGQPFSAALARHSGTFPAMLVNLVRAAEASGALGTVLKRCADHLAYQREVRRQVKSALTYPLVLLAAAVGVTGFLMVYVLPKFTAIYAGKHAMLPRPTQWLIAFTNVLEAHWKTLAPAALLFVGVAAWFFNAEAMRRYAHAMLLVLPVFGKLLHSSFVTSSLRTLGMLVESGVSMLEAVAMTRGVVNNYHFERMWSEVDARLHRGEQLSAPLYQSPLMPRPVVQMIEAGERAGSLGPVLQRVCDHLDADLRLAIKNMTQLIEPMMIAVMGVVVGGVAIALLLPILSISKVMGS